MHLVRNAAQISDFLCVLFTLCRRPAIDQVPELESKTVFVVRRKQRTVHHGNEQKKMPGNREKPRSQREEKEEMMEPL